MNELSTDACPEVSLEAGFSSPTSSSFSSEDRQRPSRAADAFPGWAVVFLVLLLSSVIVWVTGAMPMIRNAEGGLSEAAYRFGRRTSQVASTAMGVYFGSPVRMVRQVVTAIEEGQLNVSDRDSVVSWVGPFAPDDNYNFIMMDEGLGWMVGQNTFSSSTLIQTRAPPGEFYAYRLNHSATNVQVSVYRASALPILLNTFPNFSFVYPFLTRPPYLHFKASPQRGWTSPFTSINVNGEQTLVIEVGAPLWSSNGTFLGAVLVVQGTRYVNAYLESLPATFGQAITIFDVATGYLFGSNYHDTGLRAVSPTANRIASFCEATSGAVTTLCRNVPHETLRYCQAPCSFRYRDGAPGLIFQPATVRAYVDEIRDAFGLNMRVVTIVPENVLLATAREQTILIIAIAAALLGMIILFAGAVSWLALRPLRKMEGELIRIVSLRGGSTAVAEAWEESSPFIEVRAVLRSFQRLVDEMRVVRSFLPHVVLRALNDLSSSDSTGSTSHHRASQPGVGRGAVTLTEVLRATDDPSQTLRALNRANIRLVLSPSLCQRVATVVFINISNTHAIASAHRCDVLEAWLACVTTSLLTTVRNHLGVVEHFSGDRYLVSFNGSRRCTNHPKAAIAFLTALGVEFEKLDAAGKTQRFLVDEPPQGSAALVTTFAAAGVASGTVVYGVMGTPAMHNSNLIGLVVSNASHLLQLRRPTPFAPVLLHSSVVQLASAPVPSVGGSLSVDDAQTTVSEAATQQRPNEGALQASELSSSNRYFTGGPGGVVAALVDYLMFDEVHGSKTPTFVYTLMAPPARATTSASASSFEAPMTPAITSYVPLFLKLTSDAIDLFTLTNVRLLNTIVAAGMQGKVDPAFIAQLPPPLRAAVARQFHLEL